MKAKIHTSQFSTWVYILMILIMLFSSCAKKDTGRSVNEEIWYRQAAKKWNEAIPLGNGRLGAMVFGGVDIERLQLNEESLWAGEKFESAPEDFYFNLKRIQKLVLEGDLAKADSMGEKLLTKSPTSFRSYEPLCDIFINMDHDTSIIEEYKRTLNLKDGIASISYKIGDTEFLREYLISAVDDVLAIHLSSSKRGAISGKLSIERWKDANVTVVEDRELLMDGQIIDPEDYPPDLPRVIDGQLLYNPGGSGPGGEHMKFAGRMAVMNRGGSVLSEDNTLLLDKNDEATILFTAATDYNLNMMNYDRDINPGTKASSILSQALQKSWDEIKKAHIKEHESLFNRVSLDLGRSTLDACPTNERLDSLKAGSEDPGLIGLYFQYGRYILMSSSRAPGVLPANLSGIWSDYRWAPWEADYHLNINLQAKYWPADPCNLFPALDPLTGWLIKLTESGSISADQLYGAGGWMSYTATNPFGRATPSGSTLWSQFNNGVLDPLAGAWMALTLWRHYEFSQDEDYLQKVYPVLRGAAVFVADILVEDEDGLMVVVPSTSPENQFIEPISGKKMRITRGSAYHTSITREIFDAVISSSAILGKDLQLRTRLTELRKQLPPFKIGKNGTLQEWIEDYEEAEPEHRHMSHLLGLFPFSQITPDQPELFKAAEKAIERRIDYGCRWNFNIANMYARLGKGNLACQNIRDHLSKGQNSSYFRVGGGGGISGTIHAVAEMLLQSNIQDQDGKYVIHLLPALPSAWPEGEVRGLRARGGYEVDMVWEGGNLRTAKIRSSREGVLKIKYRDKTESHDVKAGQLITFLPD